MKKILIVLLIAVLLAFSVPVCAAGTPTIAVGTVQATAGETVDVTISVKNNPGITSLKLKVTYDSALTMTGVVHNSAIGSNFQTSPQLTSPATLNWYNGSTDTTGDWVFVTMTFTVDAAATSGEHAVSVTYDPDDVCNIAGSNVAFTVEDGGVNVICSHSFTEKLEDVAHLRSTAAKCTEHNTYWYDCAKCDVKSDSLYFDGAAIGPHSYTEKLEDAAHLVAGSGADCQDAKEYYYDCADCDTVGSTTWASTAVGPHSMSSDWTAENGYHFHKCTVTGCTHTEDRAACSGGTATCQAKAECTVCSQEYGEKADHSYTVPQSNETQHWNKCANCDATDTKENHKGGTATCQAKAECTVCSQEYGEKADHSYTVPQSNETQHWNKCANCDATDTRENHKGGAANCKVGDICSVCSYQYGPVKEDVHASNEETYTAKDENDHEKKYVCCSALISTEPHSYDDAEDMLCNLCSYDRSVVYAVTTGAQQEVESGKEALFVSEAEFAKFRGVKVDGADVAPENYTAVEGSTQVTLKASYISTLSVGTHTLTVLSVDGAANTTFTVKAAPAPAPAPAPAASAAPTAPDTGDSSNLLLWACLLAAAVVGSGVLVLYSKKKHS